MTGLLQARTMTTRPIVAVPAKGRAVELGGDNDEGYDDDSLCSWASAIVSTTFTLRIDCQPLGNKVGHAARGRSDVGG